MRAGITAGLRLSLSTEFIVKEIYKDRDDDDDDFVYKKKKYSFTV